MRVLILTGGEDAAPLLRRLEAEGWACACRSSREFVSSCLPSLFSSRLCRLERKPRSCRRGHARKVLEQSARELRLYLEQHSFDAILCTQVPGALLLTEALRQHPLPVRTCLVTLGDAFRPGTELCSVDRFVVSGEELIPQFTARGIPAEKIFCHQPPNGV